VPTRSDDATGLTQRARRPGRRGALSHVRGRSGRRVPLRVTIP
jgi:hypothetical protein